MTQQFFIDADGRYLGSFDGVEPPPGAIEVTAPPDYPDQVFDGDLWRYSAAGLLAYAAAKRWEAEAGGIVVAGMFIATDDRSKLMIMGARNAANADPAFVTRWKVSGSVFADIGAAEIIAISDAVAAHVAACFAKEAEVSAAIEAGTITMPAQIDTEFAPLSIAD